MALSAFDVAALERHLTEDQVPLVRAVAHEARGKHRWIEDLPGELLGPREVARGEGRAREPGQREAMERPRLGAGRVRSLELRMDALRQLPVLLRAGAAQLQRQQLCDPLAPFRVARFELTGA